LFGLGGEAGEICGGVEMDGWGMRGGGLGRFGEREV